MPVKGVDYFTPDERQEMSDALLEDIADAKTDFNENAADKTSTFNSNASSKTSTFNSNAASKTSEYNANAATQVSAFNSNIATTMQSMISDFNSNATSKTSAFDENATSKTSTFNSNATSKTSDFNTNATNKTTDFNTNATNKTTEFNNAVASKEGEIEEAGEEQINAIQETLPYSTFEGTELTFEGTTTAPFKSVQAYGNREDPKNLFVYSEGSYEVYGVTISFSDGVITLNGTSTTTLFGIRFNVFSGKLKPGTYKVKMFAGSDPGYNSTTQKTCGYIYLSADGVSYTGTNITDQSPYWQEINVPAEMYCNATYFLTNNITYDNFKLYPMLTSDLTQDEFVPFDRYRTPSDSESILEYTYKYVTGEQTIAATTEDGNETYIVDLGEIQLRKQGDVADYIFKNSDGKWYIKKYIESKELDGTETISYSNGVFGIADFASDATGTIAECNYYTKFYGYNGDTGSSTPDKFFDIINGSLKIKDTSYNSASSFKTWLSGLSFKLRVDYIKSNPENVEITDEDLIEVLDALVASNGLTKQLEWISESTFAFVDMPLKVKAYYGTYVVGDLSNYYTKGEIDVMIGETADLLDEINGEVQP